MSPAETIAHETPIFAQAVDDFAVAHDGRAPGDLPDEVENVEQVATPLLQDVIIHGSTPWDEERRERLAQHLPKKPVVRARKRTNPRPQRKAAAR